MGIKIGAVNADTSVKLGSTNIKSGYIGYNFFYGKLFPVLDLFPTSVHHAYSLRKLKSTYGGFCLRIRRTTATPSVTTTTVDLSFDTTTDTITLNSAITYVSGTTTSATNLGQFCASIINGYSNPDSVNINQNIFVVTWYDQSGNSKNPTQSTTGSQPRLVNSGNLELSGGKVAVRFVKASTNFLTINDTTINTNNISSYFVGAFVTTVTAQIGYGLGANTLYFPYSNGTNVYSGYRTSVTAINLEPVSTNRKLIELLAPSPLNSAVVQSWINGTAKGTVALANFLSLSIQLGTVLTNYYDGYIQEVIGWQTNVNRLEKEININSFWQIF